VLSFLLGLNHASQVSSDVAKTNHQSAPGAGIGVAVLQRPVPATLPTEVNRTMQVTKSVHMPVL